MKIRIIMNAEKSETKGLCEVLMFIFEKYGWTSIMAYTINRDNDLINDLERHLVLESKNNNNQEIDLQIKIEDQ